MKIFSLKSLNPELLRFSSSTSQNLQVKVQMNFITSALYSMQLDETAWLQLLQSPKKGT